MTPVEERIDHEALRLLDLICLDSLEAPLSHVDDPEADGNVTDLFRRLKAEIVALLTEHSAREEAIGRYVVAIGRGPNNRDESEIEAASTALVRSVGLPATEPAQRDEPPEGYIVPQGDERCGFTMDACTCMKRKGHDGLHACVHGGWRG